MKMIDDLDKPSCGYFKIERSTFLSVVSTAVTYTIILVNQD